MIHFTKHAENKFDILNKYKVYITREQIEYAINSPEIQEKKETYYLIQKEDIKVIYKKENKVISVLTFYPIKKN